MDQWIKDSFQIRAHLYDVLTKDKNFIENFIKACVILVEAINSGGKILIFGNGGSAAEAQHFAAEIVSYFERKRRALPAIALTTDSSILTAVSNDFSFAHVFERQIEALCKSGDVVVGLTTSDVTTTSHSQNILNAFQAARKKGAKTIGLFSVKTKVLLDFVDVALIVPDENTARIQEAHLALTHMFCGQIENNI